EADEPDALLGDVFAPLVESGARLVLGFHHDDSASLAKARALAAGAVTSRVAACVARIEALVEAGQRHKSDLVPELSRVLKLLRQAMAENSTEVAEKLPDLERRIARAERKQREQVSARRRADAISADRGLLEATKVRAAVGGLAEHLGLTVLYQTALDLLAEPADVTAFHDAVWAYQDAVRRELAKGERE
ncbi:hypothetical protein, partial [Actinophytocola sp.]|uniref:hypothetical protein n=1 Tax=Actinophytocola sp. TaxID=1872138 RepID=UPI0038999D80